MTTKTVTVYDRAASMTVGLPLQFSPAQFALIKAQCVKDFSDDEFLFFAQFAASKGLNPLAKEIYAWKQQGKIIFVTAIDGFRKKAGESGRYNGRTAPEWMDADGNWHTAWIRKEPPAACRVGVRIEGHHEPTFSNVSFREFDKGTPTWKAMPAHMLAKVAESHALRAAFPDKLAGLYSEDEVVHPGSEVVEGVTRKVVNVASMLDEDSVAPDVIDPPAPDVIDPPAPDVIDPPAPSFNVADWVAGAEQVAKVYGWGPDEYDSLIGVALKSKGFKRIEDTSEEWREKMLNALRDDAVKAKRNAKRKA